MIHVVEMNEWVGVHVIQRCGLSVNFFSFCDKNAGVWAIVRKKRYVLYSSLWEATHVSKHFIMWTWVKLTRQNVTI